MTEPCNWHPIAGNRPVRLSLADRRWMRRYLAQAVAQEHVLIEILRGVYGDTGVAFFIRKARPSVELLMQANMKEIESAFANRKT
jgi:hypothetical protein